MQTYVICPTCKERINLFKRKDFESFSKIEYLEHLKKQHPEKATGLGIPFTPIKFKGY